MTERDPLELLSVVDRADVPDQVFRADLLERLLGDVAVEAESSSPPPDVFDLAAKPDRASGRASWNRPVLVAAAVALIVGVVTLIVTRSGQDDGVDLVDVPTPTAEPLPTPGPTTPATPTPAPTATTPPPTPVALPDLPAVTRPTQPALTVDLAQSVLAEIGPEGLVLARVEETFEVEVVTFDPNDPDRFLLADLNGLLRSVPQLVSIAEGGGSTVELFDDGSRRTGGQFSRDGYIVRGPAAFDTSVHIFDPNSAELVTETDSGLMGSLFDVEGSTTVTMAANQVGCPFTSINVNTSTERHLVDERDNGFARVAIIEPGVAMAFPYGPDKDDCSPTAAAVTGAWSLVDGSPVLHPLASQVIARAVVSGDGSRAAVLRPGGELSVVALPSLAPVAELGSVEALHTYTPLALNHNGTIAAAAADDGTLRVWHVDTGTLLIERSSDPITVTDRLRAGAMLANDSGRAAIRIGPDDGPATWEIITLDANEWIERACEAGFVLSEADRAESAIDDRVICDG
ncbi:MAG: hypothetical protein AAF480_12055 [Actinomycetota bacterium]